MIHLTTVTKPLPPPPDIDPNHEIFSPPRRDQTPGNSGVVGEVSRSLKYIVTAGKSGPLPASRGHSALESVIGPTDDRTRILDTDLSPWRMVCALRIRGPSGTTAIGTGWLVGPRTVVTAGHCVYYKKFFGGWANAIEVSPGRNGTDCPFTTAVSHQFRTLDRWEINEDADFDIGCIQLEKPFDGNVGWFSVATIPPSDLEGYLVNISGYPSDRGAGMEQFHHKNRVLHVTDHRVFYDVDTYGGQSGAPVWIHESPGAPPIVIGIHAYGIGGSANGLEANSAPRIIPEVLDQIREWVNADGGWPDQP